MIPYLNSRTVTDDAPAGSGEYGTLLRLTDEGQVQFVKTYTGPGQTTTIANEWILGSPVYYADVGPFEVRATLLAGALTSGTVDTWLPMIGDREWYASGTGDGTSASARLRIEIREGSGIVQASATITIGGSAAQFGD
jgi:hypothetical protein